KCISHGNPRHGVEQGHDQHIVEQGQDRACGKTDVLEPEPDVEEHEHRGDDYSHDGVGPHLAADRGADVLKCDQRVVHLEVVHHGLVQGLAGVKVQGGGLEDDLAASLHL